MSIGLSGFCAVERPARPEIVARIAEKAFYYLEAPVARVTGYDIVIPLFARENSYIPSIERIVRESRKLLEK